MMGVSVERKPKTNGYFTVLLVSFAAGLLLFLLQTAVFRLTFSTAGELPVWMTDILTSSAVSLVVFLLLGFLVFRRLPRRRLFYSSLILSGYLFLVLLLEQWAQRSGFYGDIMGLMVLFYMPGDITGFVQGLLYRYTGWNIYLCAVIGNLFPLTYTLFGRRARQEEKQAPA
jgi:hypothetical protein